MKILEISHKLKCNLVKVKTQHGTCVGYLRIVGCNGKVIWFMELSEGDDSPMELLEICESQELEAAYQDKKASQKHMKTSEIILAENVLTWFVLNAIEYMPIDGESTKCLVSFDDIDRGEGRSEKPIYRRIVNNALKVLAQHAPESPTYIRAKEAWETLPTYTSYNIQNTPPKST